MDNNFRSRLARGELLVGTLVSLSSPEVTEILSTAGFDWLFIDLEHSPMDARDAQALLQAAGGRVDCVLRVALNDEIWIKKALDTGCAGVMIPQVNSAEDARKAVQLSKYPPQGRRSAGLARAHGYGVNLQAYYDSANQGTAVIVQIEHSEAVRNIDAILSVEGIDAALVGPYDLSASMGLIGQVEHPEVQAAITRVKEACQRRGMPVGIFVGGPERAKGYIQDGFRLVAVSTDTLLLVQAARNLAQMLR
jgi:2-dehydro-3-deoxyglucarate aldolase/4-hydroxy-2-oxoheptanedioate aldolase